MSLGYLAYQHMEVEMEVDHFAVVQLHHNLDYLQHFVMLLIWVYLFVEVQAGDFYTQSVKIHWDEYMNCYQYHKLHLFCTEI